MDGTCSDGHPCPAMGPLEAREALVEILAPTETERLRSGHIAVEGAAPFICYSFGGAGGNHTAARCLLSDERDLSCEMIRARAALEWRRYSGVVYQGFYLVRCRLYLAKPSLSSGDMLINPKCSKHFFDEGLER